MPEQIVIQGNQIGRGESKVVNFHVARLPSNTEIDIPVHIYRAEEDGPVLLLLAGMHGDEVNGVEIIRRMIADKSVITNKGTVIAIPILNVYGFLNYSRDVPDGKDVNRSFPGSTRGSLASRIAYLFMNEILPVIDCGIDFHTGGGMRYNFPQVRCKFDAAQHEELAEAFNAPFLLNSPFRDKSLRKEAAKKGKSIIVYEAGESLRLDEQAVTQGILGAKKVMQHLGMVPKSELPINETIIFKGSSWLRASRSGMFHLSAQAGQKVKSGQKIGEITDPFGSFSVKVKASKTGYIVGLNHAPIVSQGDALAHIGVI